MTRSKAKEVETLEAGLHTDKGIFVTSEGFVLTLCKTNPLLIERLANTQKGKPEVPEIEVSAPGGRKRFERNPNDPTYQQELSAWRIEKGVKLAQYLFAEGIQENPPAEYAERMRAYFDDEPDSFYKYLWIGEMVGGVESDEAADLTAAIMGMVYPTQGGMEDAAASFRSNGQRSTD